MNISIKLQSGEVIEDVMSGTNKTNNLLNNIAAAEELFSVYIDNNLLIENISMCYDNFFVGNISMSNDNLEILTEVAKTIIAARKDEEWE